MTTTKTITGIVLDSGAPGSFDTNNSDFDLLRDSVVTAGLAGALDSTDSEFTVFAPTDAAFIGLAQGLGYSGSDESGALGHIVEALTLLGGGDPIPLLTNVLTYHVVEGAVDKATVVGLGDGAEIETLLGANLTLNLTSEPPSLADADDGFDDPGLIGFDIGASNGIIHVLDGVLLPVSVSGILSQPDTDFILGNNSSEIHFTGAGQDFIDGNGGKDLIGAGAGDDIVLGGTGADLIFGGRGRDVLRGDEGNDKIFGGLGKDTLDGGTGDDILFGGRGRDTFVFETGDGSDTIYGFRNGEDRIDLSGYDGIESFADLEHAIDGKWFRTVIELEGGDDLTLVGLRASRLDEGDFIFA